MDWASRPHASPAFDDYRLVQPPATDRLPAMLFLAALVHGVLILGVTFNPALSDRFTPAISLEVTIVANPDSGIERQDRAEYLAQTNQRGGGNTTREVRPSAPARSLSPIDNPGETGGERLMDTARHERAAERFLTTRNDQNAAISDNPRQKPQREPHTAIALERGSETTLPLPQEARARLEIHDDDPRQLIVSADTREATIAAYLDSWKRRVERVGAGYFPERGQLDRLKGSPTLEVSIDVNGQLVEVLLRQSSGSSVLDRAALDILRRASPFEPFPAAVRAEYDSVRFAYKWLFSGRNAARTAGADSGRANSR